MLLAAVLVMRVRETADRDVPERAVIESDEYESVLVQQSAQPVPNTALIDEERGSRRK